MFKPDQAKRFAEQWIRDWNSHDLDAILSHYADDFEMQSPVIVHVAGEPSGILKGKKKVGAYWAKALQRFPDLRFFLVAILRSVRSLTLYYRGVDGKLAAEVFFFNAEGQIEKAIAHYE
ncbi:MAG TPA: nuclear transport factor 2 family protein [Candidatus Acidoferrum sp.]